MQSVLPVLIFFAAVAVLAFAATREVKDLDPFRAEATEQFSAWLAGDSAGQLELGPGHCTWLRRVVMSTAVAACLLWELLAVGLLAGFLAPCSSSRWY